MNKISRWVLSIAVTAALISCSTKDISPAYIGLVLHRAQTGPDMQTYVIRTLGGQDVSLRSPSREAIPGDCVSFEDGEIVRLGQAVKGQCRIED